MLDPNFVLPAGEYLIIDPSYACDDSHYYALLDVFEAHREGILTDPVTGCRFAWSCTDGGDGVYTDNEGYVYGVDSGIIACLPLAMVDAAVLSTLHGRRDESVNQLCRGRMVTFTEPCRFVLCDDAGLIRFGTVIIDTGE